MLPWHFAGKNHTTMLVWRAGCPKRHQLQQLTPHCTYFRLKPLFKSQIPSHFLQVSSLTCRGTALPQPDPPVPSFPTTQQNYPVILQTSGILWLLRNKSTAKIFCWVWDQTREMSAERGGKMLETWSGWEGKMGGTQGGKWGQNLLCLLWHSNEKRVYFKCI